MVAHKKKAKKIKVVKIEAVEPDKHKIEIEVEGYPEVPPPVTLPVEVELDAPEKHENAVWKWLTGIWGGD